MVVKKAVKAWRYYLQGRHFISVTDHKPLFWLMTTPHPRGKFARLAIQLSEYDFEIRHRACTKHINADALGRLTKKAVGREPLENELFATTAYMEIDIWTQPKSLPRIQEANVEEDSPLHHYEWKEGVLWKTFPNGIKVRCPHQMSVTQSSAMSMRSKGILANPRPIILSACNIGGQVSTKIQ